MAATMVMAYGVAAKKASAAAYHGVSWRAWRREIKGGESSGGMAKSIEQHGISSIWRHRRHAAGGKNQ